VDFKLGDVINSYSGAHFSEDKRCRFILWRNWLIRENEKDRRIVTFVGLNPSRANDRINDPTIRRCIDFAHRWNCTGMIMVNLFPVVDTYHIDLITTDTTTNLTYLEYAFRQSQKIVLCWGSFKAAALVAPGMVEFIKELRTDNVFTFGFTKEGYPKHPLYLSKGTELKKINF
jgi:hypothetical protein